MNYAQQLRDAANFVRIQPQSVVVNIELAEPLAEWLEWEASWMEEHSSTFYASGVNTVAMIILGIPETGPVTARSCLNDHNTADGYGPPWRPRKPTTKGEMMFAQWYEDAQRDTEADRQCDHGLEHCPDCERAAIDEWHAEHDPTNQR